MRECSGSFASWVGVCSLSGSVKLNPSGISVRSTADSYRCEVEHSDATSCDHFGVPNSKIPNQRGVAVISDVLKASAPRSSVTDSIGDKIQYAVRFAERMAKEIATDLQPRMKGITASAKRTAGSTEGKKKQLDVNFSTPEHGLLLGISLKSVHTRDAKRQKDKTVKEGRYTHNMKRNEEELRIEAGGYHKRQPYAVMIGVLFLPFDSCDDGSKNQPSSFGSWVKHLRPHTRRVEPNDDPDRFEKIYVALYEVDGSDLRFFDVEAAPPKNGRPPLTGPRFGFDLRLRRALSYPEFLDACYEAYLQRNDVGFQWASGEVSPLDIGELSEPDDDLDDDDVS